MDREYLEDYEQKERSEYETLLKEVREDKLVLGKDRYPPDKRFVKIQKPVALASSISASHSNFWGQIPFSGSLIIFLSAIPQDLFERWYFQVSEIPKIVDFIKETGRLQVALSAPPTYYEGLDFLDPFFKELNPPVYHRLPNSIFGTKEENKTAATTFSTIASINYMDFLAQSAQEFSSRVTSITLRNNLETYSFLKLGYYSVVEDIENLMIDDPQKALSLLNICALFIVHPAIDLRIDMMNFALNEVKTSRVLPLIYQPEEIRFPCEIGKFLLRKLTFAAQDVRACNDLMDSYDAYDLRKVQESLNEAIVMNHPDILNKSADEFSEILDNVWNDPTIPKRIKNLRRGIPMLIAAIGTAVSAYAGSLEGFLAGLGFNVGAAFLKADIERLSEKVGKFFANRSYQANVYDFKKKYNGRVVHTQKKEQD